MGGMLVDSKNACCCPEMRCCAPETVTATVSGMSGEIVHNWPGGALGAWKFDPNETPAVLLPERGENWRCPEIIIDPTKPSGFVYGPLIYSHLCWDGMLVQMGMPDDISCENLLELGACFGMDSAQNFWVLPETAYSPWNPAAFASITVNSNAPDNNLRYCYSSGTATYTENPDRCSLATGGHPLFCSLPGGDGLQHGSPRDANLGEQPSFVAQSDLNGTYVCQRPDIPLRPQLKCRVNRQVPLSTESPHRGVTEATLLYNVDPKREWVYWIPPGQQDPCWDVFFPPGGDNYVVDYRCDKRNPWYSTFGYGYCVRGKCTVTNQGVVKPHLYYYNTGLGGATSPADVAQMQSANLYLRLIPKDYENDPNGRFPTWWQVSGVDIRGGGYGYEVGDIFEVDFDIRRPWLGGEIMTLFPYTEPNCILPEYLSWTDKYGQTGTLKQSGGTPGWELFQRLRVSAVDENGAITDIEVVPIYKSPEFSDPPLCFVQKPSNQKTEYYVGYGRILCHPRSVHMPGIGYNVGDTIEWYCDDPPCTVHQAASAVVIDVDEEGGILDWLIKGSDAWRYVSQNFCVFPFANDGQFCTTSCLTYPWGGEGFEDERGSYSWSAKSLCSLNWVATGVPVRKQRGCENQSSFTNLSITISRRACETSIEVLVAQWPYDQMSESTDPATRNVALFPAFPKCNGGGAVVRPTYGGPGANESEFGSSLTGGVIEAAGTGYCYREKYHVEPTLPNEVPSLGGGSGARIASFTFRSVHDFPSPSAPYGDSPPAYNRFSYFPVTGAQVDTQQRGSGYSVGQTFEVYPSGGRGVTDMWRGSGGDNPEACPNGAWYEGARAVVLCDGDYMCMTYNTNTGVCFEATCNRPSKCTLRISEVNEDGGIVALEVVNGGMMFKTAWGIGKKNPAAFIWLQSTLGYGAYITATFDENYASDSFGSLVSVAVVAPPPGTLDPKHPAVNETPWRPAQAAAAMPTGGRDYADESAGYFWMLEDIYVGIPVLKERWSLQAHMGWHGHPPGQPSPEPQVPRNWSHEYLSTYSLLQGSEPQFVPRSSVCAFGDCYHELLSKSYPLVKVWAPSGYTSHTYAPPLAMPGQAPWEGSVGNPGTYGLLIRKGMNQTFDYPISDDGPFWEDGLVSYPPNPARTEDYIVIEHGATITLGYTPACPDHSNGATNDGAAA